MPATRGVGVTSLPHSVIRALKILRLLGESPTRISLTEVASLAQLPKGTVHRLLVALEEEGFALQDRESRKWGLGFVIAQQYHAFCEQVSLVQVATPSMQQLRDQVQETVTLAVEDAGQGVCIQRCDPAHELRFQSTIGNRVPLHAGASRKVLLAFLSEVRREQILADRELAPITERTILDSGRLRKELEEIRRCGYAVSEGEHNPGVAAVAAPVRDASSRVVASLAVAGPAHRFTPEQVRRALPRLLDTAWRISQGLGWRDSFSWGKEG